MRTSSLPSPTGRMIFYQTEWVAAGEGVVQYQCPVAATLPGGRRVV